MGRAYNRATLEVHYKGKTIAEVLDMPIEEAVDFFAAVPAIARQHEDAGRGRAGLRPGLGQAPPPPLSGGEAQAGQALLRAAEAVDRDARSTCSTKPHDRGCTFEDIRKLLLVLGALVDQGNTVLVIEHNLDVIKDRRLADRHGARGWLPGAALVIARGHSRGGSPDQPRQLHRSIPQGRLCSDGPRGQAAGPQAGGAQSPW